MSAEPAARILVVDDKKTNLELIEATLQGLPILVDKALSADEALALVAQHEFALIVMDIHMPGTGGFELIRILRQRVQLPHTPIIIATATYKSDAVVLRGYQLGAVDVLFKPTEPEILRAKVQVFAELWREKERLRLKSEGES